MSTICLHAPTYPSQPEVLRKTLNTLLQEVHPPAIQGEVMAILAPDTNLLMAGPATAQAYKLIEGTSYDTVVLIAPGLPESAQRISIPDISSYQTPLGTIPIDEELREELCDESDDIFLNNELLYLTTGIDAQLAFLQSVIGTFKLVPILIGQDNFELGKELGSTLAEVLSHHRTLIVATAEIQQATSEQFKDLKEGLEHFDLGRIIRLIHRTDFILQGESGLMATLLATTQRGAQHARLLEYHAPDLPLPGFFSGVIWKD